MISFPQSLPPLCWQAQAPAAPEALLRLMRQQSLTTSLQATGLALNVHPAFQGQTVRLWEGEELDGNTFHVREVCLLLEQTPVIWARSICRQKAAQWIDILACGTQPLGIRLFGGLAKIERGPLVFAAVPTPLQDQTAYAPWLRRSRFSLDGETLVLTEGFLPQLTQFFR